MALHIFDLTGKTALVTGSTQGIGLALATGLASANARVIIHGRNVEKTSRVNEELRKQGKDIHSACFDVTHIDSIQKEISRLHDELGSIDILINNAGIVRRKSLLEMDLSEWNEVIATDLTSAFLVSKFVVPKMLEQKRGKIINICSLMSEIGRETVGAYAAAKGGLKMLTKNMATEWGPYNVQVNGVGPGFIATPINEEYRAPGNPLNEFIVSRTPANRWGRPDDLVGTAIFLASAASDFVNGQIIYVDGGLLATVGRPATSREN